MRRVSLDKAYTTADIDKWRDVQGWDQFQPGKYVACMYNGNWYVGNITDQSDEHCDILVLFMKRSESGILS